MEGVAWGHGGSTHCVEELELKGEGHSVGELHEASNVFHVLEAFQVEHQDLWKDLYSQTTGRDNTA